VIKFHKIGAFSNILKKSKILPTKRQADYLHHTSSQVSFYLNVVKLGSNRGTQGTPKVYRRGALSFLGAENESGLQERS
jgi:hypothetical protein